MKTLMRSLSFSLAIFMGITSVAQAGPKGGYGSLLKPMPKTNVKPGEWKPVTPRVAMAPSVQSVISPTGGEKGLVTSYTCQVAPPTLPKTVTTNYPNITYIGMAPNGRAVYYQEAKKIFYFFNKSKFSDSPLILQWSDKTDRRCAVPCPGSGAIINCPWNVVYSQGVREFARSMHITCGGDNFSNESPNKDLARTIPNKNVSPNHFVDPVHNFLWACEAPGVLNLNTMKCDEPQLHDPTLKICTAHGQCTNGNGCLPQRSADLFQLSEYDSYKKFVNAQTGFYGSRNGGKFLTSGKPCTHSKECKTYSCQPDLSAQPGNPLAANSLGGRCEPRMVCRRAQINEQAPDLVQCAEGLKKHGGNICKPGEGFLPFPGMMSAVGFTKEGEFGFKVIKEDEDRIQRALRAARATEFLFTKVVGDYELNNPKSQGDAFWLHRTLKKEVFHQYNWDRKEILKNYNMEMAKIEKDYDTLMKAEEGNMAPKKMHDLDVTDAEIANRRATGIDSLVLMYRRNALFQELETQLMEMTDRIATETMTIAQNISGWSDQAESWSIRDGGAINRFDSRAMYQTKGGFWDWGWDDVYENQIGGRWVSYYTVDKGAGDNSVVIENHIVKQELTHIFQADEDYKAMKNYEGRFILMDPLNLDNTGRLNFWSLGEKIDPDDRPGWFDDAVDSVGDALFGGTDEVRHYMDLNGHNGGTLLSIRNLMKEDLKDWYAEQKKEPGLADFVYEPEIAGTEGKDCFQHMDNAKCKPFKDALDEVTDYAMAQFLSWGHKKGDPNYWGNYFNNPSMGVPLTLAKITVDFHNLNVYYRDVMLKRIEQNAAIEKLVKNIQDNYTGGQTAGVAAGIAAGGGAAAGTAGGAGKYNNSAGTKSGGGVATKSNTPINKLNLSAFHTNLLTGKPRSFDGRSFGNLSNGGTLGGSSSGIGSGGSSEAGFVSAASKARTEKMLASNKRAEARGIDVAKRTKAILKSLNGGKGGSGLAGASSSGSKSGGGGSGNKATLDKEVDDNDANSMGRLAGGAGAGAAAAGAAGGAGGATVAGALSGVDSGAGGGYGAGGGGSNSGGNGGRGDGTGMSDEEKDALMANYERNKGQYNPDEYDSLFKVVSKAYVRNLDKVLTRRKKIED